MGTPTLSSLTSGQPWPRRPDRSLAHAPSSGSSGHREPDDPGCRTDLALLPLVRPRRSGRQYHRLPCGTAVGCCPFPRRLTGSARAADRRTRRSPHRRGADRRGVRTSRAGPQPGGGACPARGSRGGRAAAAVPDAPRDEADSRREGAAPHGEAAPHRHQAAEAPARRLTGLAKRSPVAKCGCAASTPAQRDRRTPRGRRTRASERMLPPTPTTRQSGPRPKPGPAHAAANRISR
jgi:hypothetical protein